MEHRLRGEVVNRARDLINREIHEIREMNLVAQSRSSGGSCIGDGKEGRLGVSLRQCARALSEKAQGRDTGLALFGKLGEGLGGFYAHDGVRVV